MVAHNGGAYLPTVLGALAAQTRPANAILAADVGSTDDSGELLRKELGERHVITFDARKGGYGAAVKTVLDLQERLRGASTLMPAASGRGNSTVNSPATEGSRRGSAHDSPSGPGSQEWIWLLQDDAAPAPDALQRLLEALERSTTATVAGCKQLDWENPRSLVDVGLTTNKWFDRFAMINLDELDQGQYDDRTDFFAVNAAGMLVRRDVWKKLGGFDPAIPGPGDDIDFCARVRLAGHRVLVVPSAKMFHVVDRVNPLGSPAAARKAAVFTRLKHAPLWQVPFLGAGAALSAVYWLFAGFLLKAPGHAVSMFVATFAALLRPRALFRSRRSLAAARIQPNSAHRALLVGREEARNQLKSLREAVGPDEEDDDAASAPSILEPTGDVHHEAVAPMAAVRTSPLVSALGLAAILALVSIVTLSRLLGAKAISGGALLPISDTLGVIWMHATDWWISLGSGLPGRGEPFNYVLWILGALGLGDASKATLWIFLLAIPLSALTGWLASGAFSRKRWPRIVAGLLWAGAPVLQTDMAQGRLGALLAHVLLPLVVLGMIRAVGAAVNGAEKLVLPAAAAFAKKTHKNTKLGRPGVNGTPSWTAAAAAGLALAAVCAGAPSLFVLAVVAVLGTTVILRRRAKTLWWSLVPSLAIYVPYAFSALSNPRALLADPGLPLSSNPGPLWQQLLGFPTAISATPNLLGEGTLAGAGALADGVVLTWAAVLVVGVPLVAVAFVALFIPLRRAGLVRTLWLVAVLGLGLSYASGLVAVAVEGNSLVTAFNGPVISAVWFAVLGAALLGFDAVYRRGYDGVAGSGAGRRHRVSKATALVISIVLVGAPTVSLGLWIIGSFGANTAGLVGSSLVAAKNIGTIPATAADRGTGPEASRTIVLRVVSEGGIDASLMQGNGTTLDMLSGIAAADGLKGAPGDESLAGADDATKMLRETVASMLAKSGPDPRSELSKLGVGFVVLSQGDTAAELLASQLSAVPGLETVGPTDAGWLWRVKPDYKSSGATDVINRVRLVDASGADLAPVASVGQNVDAVIPAGQEGRRVSMAERFDSGWSAWLDGRQLTSSKDGWAQSFELPATGGHLEIRYEQPWNAVLNLVQLVLLGLTVLLAIPVRARRGRTGSFRDEASLHKVGRSV